MDKTRQSGMGLVEIFSDGINADRDAADYVHSTKVIMAGFKMTVELGPGGGWTARFVRSTINGQGNAE